jgi:putative membrane protein
MMGGFGMGFGGIFGVAIIVLVIALVWRQFRQDRHPENSRNSPLDTLLGSPKTSPIDILKERYARGEIEKEEYEDKKKDLI